MQGQMLADEGLLTLARTHTHTSCREGAVQELHWNPKLSGSRHFYFKTFIPATVLLPHFMLYSRKVGFEAFFSL